MSENWESGMSAEDYVAKKLIEQGWEIRIRNYRKKGLELDIIASRSERLICVEVKARSSFAFQHPRQILGHRKLKKLTEGMMSWLQSRAPDEHRNTEFWLCSVLLPTSRRKVEWIRLGLN